jgi:hypothetical protein
MSWPIHQEICDGSNKWNMVKPTVEPPFDKALAAA